MSLYSRIREFSFSKRKMRVSKKKKRKKGGEGETLKPKGEKRIRVDMAAARSSLVAKEFRAHRARNWDDARWNKGKRILRL